MYEAIGRIFGEQNACTNLADGKNNNYILVFVLRANTSLSRFYFMITRSRPLSTQPEFEAIKPSP